jgi:hypothetical protein
MAIYTGHLSVKSNRNLDLAFAKASHDLNKPECNSLHAGVLMYAKSMQLTLTITRPQGDARH